jgi:YVTN family beta-propeller protein
MHHCTSIRAALLFAVLAGLSSAQYVETTVVVGIAPQALVYDSIDRKVFVANNGSSTVSVINANTNTVVASIPVNELPTAICWSPTSNKVFVSHAPLTGNGTVSIINAATNDVVATVDVGPIPAAMTWCSALDKVYCMNQTSATITVIDCQGNQVVADVGLPNQTPNDIAYNPANNQVYVSSAAYQQTGRVRAIDCEADTIRATIVCGNNTWDVEVNPASNRVYAANTVSKTVSVINGQTNQRIGNVSTWQEPTPVLWIPSNKVFVGEYWDKTVAFMHGDSLRIQGRFPVPGNPKTMLYVPRSQHVFCTNYLSGKVSAIDARDGHEHVLVDVNVGDGPLSMALFPEEDRVYVGNSWDSTVTVIKDVVGIEEPANAVRPQGPRVVRAWPNPAASGREVTFRATGFRPTGLNVWDSDGRLVHSTTGGSSAWVAPRAGIYFCRVSDGVNSTACKLAVR